MVLLRFFTIRLIHHHTQDIKVRYRWRKTSSYVAAALSLILIAPLWLKGVQSLATYLGLASAGIAIALKEPLTHLAGWLFILWRRPFAVGDRIQIGDAAGDVIDQRIFQFTLLEIGNWTASDQSTGRLLHVPNGRIFTDVLANYTSGFEYIWHEIPVLITFESDWEKAKKILLDIANHQVQATSQVAAERIRQAARRYMIFYQTLTPTVYTSVEASGVMLTVRYMCQPRKRRSTEEAIWEDILRHFAQHSDIELAYPTQRLFARWIEEKGAGLEKPEAT